MKKILWVLLKIIYFCKRYLFALALVFCFSSAMYLGVNYLNKLVINEITSCYDYKRISVSLFLFLGAYLGIWIISNFIGYLEAFANNLFRLKVDVLMQKMFMQKSISLEQDNFFKTDFMDKYVFLSRNTYKASSFVFKIFTICFSNITIIGSSAIVFVKYEPLLAVFLAVIMVIHMLTTIIVSKLQYTFTKKQVKEERVSNYLYELFINRSSAKEMRIFEFAQKIFSLWRVNNKKYVDKRVKIDDKNNLIGAGPSIINTVIRYGAIMILFLGMRDNRYDIGTFVMLFGLFNSCNQMVVRLAKSLFSGVFDEGNYFKDFYDFVYPMSNSEIKEVISKSNPVDDNTAFEKLELKNVSYAYPNTKRNAIENINLTIKRGEIVSILGYNGSGKSTLSKIILNAFRPKEGEVLINGIPAKEMNRKNIFRLFGIVQQEFPRFSLSFRDNIRIGYIEKKDDEEEIQKAYSVSKVNAIFDKYENKDNTVLGKEYDLDGVELSGGQWQRVEVASAYMGTPEILMMDEPTASIDPIHEEEMLDELKNNLSGRTAILISHRIGFAKIANRIVILKDGKIAEVGSHKELLDMDGCYAEMFKKQKSMYEG